MRRIDIAKLRSAEVIEDREKAAAMIRSAIDARGVPGMLVEAAEEGVRVVKVTGKSLLPTKAKLPDAETLQQLAKARGIDWKDGMDARVVPYWASDERPDLHGDIVKANWHFDFYEKNPALCVQHAWDGDPIGAGLDWEVRRRVEKDYDGDALFILALFASKDDSERADSVFRLVRAGFMPACSVGFYSDRVINVTDEEERTELGLGRWGFILDGNHLIELSPVTVPANIGAGVAKSMAMAKSAGLLTAGDVEVLREVQRINARGFGMGADSWRKADAAYLEAARLLFPRTKWTGLDYDAPTAKEADATTEPEEVVGEVIEITNDGVVERLERLEDEHRALSALVSEGMQSMSMVLDDIRDAVEKLASAAPPAEGTEEEIADGADDVIDDEGDPLMEAALAAIDDG